MKKVICNDELKKIMSDTVNMICDAVTSTLGPSGNNVLVSKSDLAPFITNDGVTIAESISSSKEEENAILEIIKEASLKTNYKVGDGTTTTMVLLQSIFNLGLKEIIQGKNSIELKNELNTVLDDIINKINALKKSPSKEDLINIASTSANDSELGSFIANIYSEINNIKIEEGNKEETYYEINNGYDINTSELSIVYFENNKEIVLKDSYVLLLNGYLNSLEQISDIINEGINRNKNILIIANEYEESIKDELVIYYLQEHKNIFLTSINEYGKRKEDIIKDIAFLSSSKIRNIDYENIMWNDLGKIEELIIKRENISLINKINPEKRIKELEIELNNCHDDYDKEFIKDRIAKLNGKCATIFVGGLTNTEIKEKKMRFDDALCSLKSASNGVVVGEGITLLKVSSELESDKIANKIMKKSLEVPFHKILENAGISSLEKYTKIKDSNYKLIYNIEKNDYESINDTKIIDSVLVVIESLKNAVSIASMLLTTNYLVINDIEINNKDII